MRIRRSLFALAVLSAMPLLVACPKKETPQPPEAAPPPPPADSTPTVLTPLTDDEAGADAAPEAGPKKLGPGGNPNVARLKQCCGALRAQAKALGASPEAGMLVGAAAQCDGLAAQAGASGNAPELNVIKGILGGRNVPPVCAGF